MKPLREELAVAQTVVSVVGAAGWMLYRFARGEGPFQPEMLALAASAIYGVYLRFRVTPVANPKDADGRPLTPERPEPLPPRIDMP